MDAYAVSGTASLLTAVVLPLWMLAGLADYFCHRATSIETTSGTREAILHLIQLALVGLPITLVLFLEANAGYFLAALVFLALHHAVAAVDLVFANPRRRIAPREQMIHSFLEILPITALILLAILHWSQFSALFGLGTETPHFAPHARPLPPGLIISVLGAAFFLNLVPYLEELYRCITQANRR